VFLDLFYLLINHVNILFFFYSIVLIPLPWICSVKCTASSLTHSLTVLFSTKSKQFIGILKYSGDQPMFQNPSILNLIWPSANRGEKCITGRLILLNFLEYKELLKCLYLGKNKHSLAINVYWSWKKGKYEKCQYGCRVWK